MKRIALLGLIACARAGIFLTMSVFFPSAPHCYQGLLCTVLSYNILQGCSATRRTQERVPHPHQLLRDGLTPRRLTPHRLTLHGLTLHGLVVSADAPPPTTAKGDNVGTMGVPRTHASWTHAAQTDVSRTDASWSHAALHLHLGRHPTITDSSLMDSRLAD